jgi:ribonuclease VapC
MSRPSRSGWALPSETSTARGGRRLDWLTVIVIDTRFGATGQRDLDLFLERAGVELVLDAEQAFVARHADGRFGRGRHAAGLNFGDCFSYALARVLGELLLSKGDAFSRTDAMAALLSRGA